MATDSERLAAAVGVISAFRVLHLDDAYDAVSPAYRAEMATLLADGPGCAIQAMAAIANAAVTLSEGLTGYPAEQLWSDLAMAMQETPAE